jgi:predicted transcriptional regulator
MSPDVRLITPDDTVQQATRLMRDEDLGVLPVGEIDCLLGPDGAVAQGATSPAGFNDSWPMMVSGQSTRRS